MSTPFDAMAASYSSTWSETPRGRGQREEVWRVIDTLFRASDRVLDFGCGIGDDALHLMGRGVGVVGIDASEEMVAVARARGVEAHWAQADSLCHGQMDGVLSNFGVINCIRDVRALSCELGRVVRPGGYAALCVMGRFSWRETARYLAAFDLRRATRRWSGHARWRGIDVYYRSAREMRRGFETEFEFVRRVAIGGGDHQLYIFRRRAE